MKLNLPFTDSMTRLLPVAAAAFLCFSVTSCKTAGAGGVDPQYSSASGDSGYNPYPGQPGYQQYQAPTPTLPQQPSYQTYTPPPQPQTSYTPPPEPSYTPSPARKPVKKRPAASSSSSKSKGSYTVKAGDTLYRISRLKSVSVSQLKSANGLTSDIIRPGQSLKIP